MGNKIVLSPQMSLPEGWSPQFPVAFLEELGSSKLSPTGFTEQFSKINLVTHPSIIIWTIIEKAKATHSCPSAHSSSSMS
jgi:hypothetical protein